MALNNPSTGANTKTWALLDTGADTHLLTRDLFDELGLKGQPVHSKLQLADGDVKTFRSLETRCVVHDCNGDNPFVLEEVRVIDELPDLTGSIPTISDVLCNEHLFGLEMPVIDKGKVELLIGRVLQNFMSFLRFVTAVRLNFGLASLHSVGCYLDPITSIVRIPMTEWIA